MTRAVYIDATEQGERLLHEIGVPAGVRVHKGDPAPDVLRELLADAEIALNGHTYMDAEALAAAPQLRRIIFLGTGASSYIDLGAAQRLGIAVDTISGYGDQAVAQHAIALALSAIRQIPAMDRAVRAGHWEPLPGHEFGELTFGVVGMGGIGRATAQLASSLGFRVIGWNRSAVVDAPCPMGSLDEVLAAADVLSLHLALNDDTAGLIDSQALSGMKPGGILINTARAGLVDGTALLAALDDGRLQHAALDVFDMEPLPLADPLVARPDVTLSAHAGYKTDAAMRRLLAEALKRIACP